jgi:hypothetical protein
MDRADPDTADTKKPAKRDGPGPLGLYRGEIWIADNFDDPLPRDIQDAFKGKGP